MRRQPIGLAAIAEAKTFCIVASHRNRAAVIRSLRDGNCMRCAFESADEMHDWVGKGALEKVETRDGLTLWLTDKIRKCNDTQGSWLEPAGQWRGYRWMDSDPLVVALYNVRLDQRVKEL